MVSLTDFLECVMYARSGAIFPRFASIEDFLNSTLIVRDRKKSESKDHFRMNNQGRLQPLKMTLALEVLSTQIR